MNVLGTLSTTPHVIPPLDYFWWGCRGTACSQVEPFLEYNGDYFGFIFCPPQSNYGRVVCTSDQDWVQSNTSDSLMANILILMTSPSYQCSGSNYLSAYLGSDTTICSDSIFILIPESSGVSYLWSTGATSQTISVDSAGMFWVTVDNGLCVATDTIIIIDTVCNSSLPAFGVDDSEVCQKFCVNFSDSSSNNPTSWQWTFDGASPASSNLQNPVSICYDEPGVYDVTLVTTNASGTDSVTFNDYITVNSTPPAPTITLVGITLTSSPASSYQWQFNSVDIAGATSQSYTVMQSGSYNVIISDSNGCINSGGLSVVITGINEFESPDLISIYPNPSNGTFTVEFSNAQTNDEVTIEILDVFGRNVFSSQQNLIGKSWKKEIDLSKAARGVYYIEVKTKDNFMRKKIVISS